MAVVWNRRLSIYTIAVLRGTIKKNSPNSEGSYILFIILAKKQDIILKRKEQGKKP